MTPTPTRWRRTAAALVAGIALAVGAAACSSSGKSESLSQPASAPKKPGEFTQEGPPGATAADGTTGGGAADPRAAAPDKAAPAAPGKQPPLPVQAIPDQRSIIYTGTVTVRVKDVDKVAGQVSALATGAGGFVGGDERSSDGDRSQAQLVLRVPSARFIQVVDSIAGLGERQSRQVSTEDVTAKVVDLDARIATMQASVDRVRALLAKAQTIGEIVSLESELSRREADLESLKAQQRKLDDLTTLSTVTAILLGPQAPLARPAEPESGFLVGLKGGWRAFLRSMEILLTVTGALLPWALALGLPVLAIVLFTRRARRRILVPAFAGAGAPLTTAPPAPPRPSSGPETPDEPEPAAVKPADGS
jgi:hypothetical protein